MEYSESIKQEALALIKYLYKNMPTYNQIKGTYVGIQYVLNMLGLCSSITEIWSDRAESALKNFAETSNLIRADELNDVRQNVGELGNAKIKNYFLTSRFDVDFTNIEGQSFEDFNKQSETLIQVINQIKPVTRVLRKLYYTLKIITDLTFQSISVHYSKDIDIYAYEYSWDVTKGLFRDKTIFDKNSQLLYQLYLPYSSIREKARCLGKYDSEGIWVPDQTPNYPSYTLNNTFFTLNDLKRKFKVSKQDTFSFFLIGTHNGSILSTEEPFTYPINDEYGVSIDNDNYGIIIKFNGAAATVIQTIIRILYGRDERIDNLSKINLNIQSCFSLAPGTDYIYQDLKRFDFEDTIAIHGFKPENASENDIILLAPEYPEGQVSTTVFEQEKLPDD